MGKKEDLAAIGAYSQNLQLALDLLTEERDYLKGIAKSGLTAVDERVRAAGAAAYVSSQILVLEDSQVAFFRSNGGQIEPPSAEVVKTSTDLATDLSNTIRRAIGADAVLKAVTRFITGWSAISIA